VVGWVIIIVIMFDCQSELLLKVLVECNVNWFAEVCDHVDMWSCVEDGVVGGWGVLFVALWHVMCITFCTDDDFLYTLC
jgi:hypothetical protein